MLEKQKDEVKNLLQEASQSGTMTVNTIKSIVSDAVEKIKSNPITSSLSVEQITHEIMQVVLSTLKNLKSISIDNVTAAMDAIATAIVKREDKAGNKLDIQNVVKTVYSEVESIFTDFTDESKEFLFQIKNILTLSYIRELSDLREEIEKALNKIVYLDEPKLDEQFYIYIKQIMKRELLKSRITKKRIKEIGGSLLHGAIDVTFVTRDLAQMILENSVNAIIDACDEEIKSLYTELRSKENLSKDDEEQLSEDLDNLNELFALMIKSAHKKAKDSESLVALEELSLAHGKASASKPMKEELREDVKEGAHLLVDGSKKMLKGMIKPMAIMATPITKMAKPMIDGMDKLVGEAKESIRSKSHKEEME